MSLITQARALWNAIGEETIKNANTGQRVNAAAQAVLDAFEGIPTPVDGITPTIGANGNWYYGAVDSGKKATGIDGTPGINGTPGTNAPVTMSIFQIGANGVPYPRKLPAYPYARIITAVRISTDCAGLSVTIGATSYTHLTLVGVTIPANVELVINYLTLIAGQTSADALIIF